MYKGGKIVAQHVFLYSLEHFVAARPVMWWHISPQGSTHLHTHTNFDLHTLNTKQREGLNGIKRCPFEN